jgi:hypothetical protein
MDAVIQLKTPFFHRLGDSGLSLRELPGTDRRGMADDGDQVALAARLYPQLAEAAVVPVARSLASHVMEGPRSQKDTGRIVRLLLSCTHELPYHAWPRVGKLTSAPSFCPQEHLAH